MRLVPNLSEITECPNCGSIRLYTVEDRFADLKYFKCGDCHEEIHEGNITIDKSTLSTLSIPAEETKTSTIKIPTREEIYEQDYISRKRKEEEKEKFLFNLREEINNLKWHAHTVEDAQLMEHLSFIFTQIADYIENH